MELKVGFKAVELEGAFLFIDIVGKSWLSNENHLDTQGCATWQALIR